MVSDEALKKLQEQIAAWPMTQRFVVQQLIRDYLRNREDLRAYEATGLASEEGGDVMERLTFEGNFCDIAQCRELPCPHNGARSQRKVWDRLAAYEDTGLTPAEVHSMYGEWCAMMSVLNSIGSYDRLRELAEADKDGRLVVLPCKVGDVVFGIHNGQTILPMVAKWIETNTDGWCIAVQYAPMAPNFYQFSDFGKTVFLTREEAKKALEAMKDD